MRKIDKLVLGSFLGPFFLTFFVVIFILLSQFMLKYIDEIVGKDLDTMVILELIFYFSIFMTPNAFPLAVLLSSLMTFGNLGQHFELTAMKGAGISLIRVLVPIFVFTLILTGLAYYSNNYIVPKANLKAFSLLYDVKQMKPSMELKEGAFYNGIEGYSIKVGEKLKDGSILKDIIIYDHTDGRGNRNVTLADSGRMYNIYNDRYMVLEMFDGRTYMEQQPNRSNMIRRVKPDPFLRNEFESQKVVFSLASFDLKRTKEELFASNRLMKNSFQLRNDVDSMKTEYRDKTEEVKEHSFRFFDYHLQDIVGVYKQRALERAARERRKQMTEEEKVEEERERLLEDEDSVSSEIDRSKLVPQRISLEKQYDSTETEVRQKANYALKTEDALSEVQRDTISVQSRIPSAIQKRIQASKNSQLLKNLKAVNSKASAADTLSDKRPVVKRSFEENISMIDSILKTEQSKKTAIKKSLSHVRFVKNNMTMRDSQLEKLKAEINKFQLERYKKLSYAVTILIMFFIGAPLGSIIKRGGLGIPVLISISFYVMFYIVSMISEKYTRTDLLDPFVAAWMSNFILFPIGLFFMKQAKNDARLFDMDFYNIAFVKIGQRLHSLKNKFTRTKNLN